MPHICPGSPLGLNIDRCINEMVTKPSLRSAVACYLSSKGRHLELNLFELPKIDILF